MEWIMLIRWIGGGAVLAIGLFVIIGNWITLINLLSKKGSTSFIPLIGGCLAVIGILIAPFPNRFYWFWTPLLFDWGCIPMFAWIAVTRLAKKNEDSEQSGPGYPPQGVGSPDP